MAMNSCFSCGGFAPRDCSTCPHCDARLEGRAAQGPVARALASLTLLATSGATAVTLMACYGMPVCDTKEDADGDGVMSCYDDGETASDCDDSDASIHPGADDALGDGIDQNCDGADGINSGTGGQSAGGQSAGGQSAGGQSAGGQSAGGQSAGGASAGGAGGAGGG